MGVKSELAAAANCGDQVARAVQAAARESGPPPVGLDNNVEHAVRMTRLAVYHACKARPELRPPNNYDTAVAEHRAGRRR